MSVLPFPPRHQPVYFIADTDDLMQSDFAVQRGEVLEITPGPVQWGYVHLVACPDGTERLFIINRGRENTFRLSTGNEAHGFTDVPPSLFKPVGVALFVNHGEPGKSVRRRLDPPGIKPPAQDPENLPESQIGTFKVSAKGELLEGGGKKDAGHGYLNRVHPDERDAFARQWLTALLTQEYFNGVCRLKTAHGYLAARVLAVPVPKKDDGTVEWYGAVHYAEAPPS